MSTSLSRALDLAAAAHTIGLLGMLTTLVVILAAAHHANRGGVR